TLSTMAILISSVLGFLVLLAVTQADDPKCEDLTKPLVLEDHSAILGKWFLIEGLSSNPWLQNGLRMINSSWMAFAPGSPKDTIIRSRGSMQHGSCQYSSGNMTLKNSTYYASGVPNETTAINLVPSCSDCITLSFHRQLGDEAMRSLFFLSKRHKVSESEQEQFWKQADCFGFIKEPHFTYDGVTGQYGLWYEALGTKI
ncbi:hypothetical protein NFI96_022619, partial [Prochilodus magdalenae]